jgi:hypothetical protein
MKRFITLRTEKGDRVRIDLDGWGAGIDRNHRRWTREPDAWRCVDNGDVARHTGLFFSRPLKPLGAHRD